MEANYENLKIIHFGKVTSTMEIAKKLASRSDNSSFLVIAEEQTAGRGRGNNTWHSPNGGFWGTFVIFFDNTPSYLDFVFFHYAIGLAVVDALRDLFNVKIYLKWPNDFIFNGKKLGGILLEYISGTKEYLLIGIGINLKNPLDTLPEEIQHKTSSLYQYISNSISFTDIGKKLFFHIQKRLSHVIEDKLSIIVKDYNKMLFNFGKDILYKSRRYTCLGINFAGKLQISNNSQNNKALTIEDS
ncbi:MAG: biotin--[acetyl-CoA-carboxylase] ligase, partial [Candidatus Heimdallarchaeaceae archaeon]